MAFDWNNFLSLAQELAKRGDVASKRSAISRAYYCVFNIALARAKALGAQLPPESVHNWCWRKYADGPDPSCKQLGITGQRMKAKRAKADYESADFANLDKEVERILLEALKFQKDLAALDRRYPLV